MAVRRQKDTNRMATRVTSNGWVIASGCLTAAILFGAYAANDKAQSIEDREWEVWNSCYKTGKSTLDVDRDLYIDCGAYERKVDRDATEETKSKEDPVLEEGVELPASLGI